MRPGGILSVPAVSVAKLKVGMNAPPIVYFYMSPFLNILKSAYSSENSAAPAKAGWFCNGADSNQQYIQIDANGYPTSMTSLPGGPGAFSSFSVLMNDDSHGQYPSGKYILLYDGSITIALGGDASSSGVISGTNRGGITGLNYKIYNVTPTSGLSLTITGITTPATNIAVVYAPTATALVQDARELLYLQGYIFDPFFVTAMQPFNTIRFMDWFITNNAPNYTWAQRPLPSWCFWGSWGASSPINNYGVPFEVAIALSNVCGSNFWCNLPIYAYNADPTNFLPNLATLIASGTGWSMPAPLSGGSSPYTAGLNYPLICYAEFGNELWNSATGITSKVQTLAEAQFPNYATVAMPNGGNPHWVPYDIMYVYAGMVLQLFGAQIQPLLGPRFVGVVAGQFGGNDYVSAAIGGPALLASGSPKLNGTAAFAVAPYMLPCPGGSGNGNYPSNTAWEAGDTASVTALGNAYTTGGLDTQAPNGYIDSVLTGSGTVGYPGLAAMWAQTGNTTNFSFTGSISGTVISPPSSSINLGGYFAAPSGIVGMTLTGTGIVPGTIITGWNGTNYTVNISQTVASTTINCSFNLAFVCYEGGPGGEPAAPWLTLFSNFFQSQSMVIAWNAMLNSIANQGYVTLFNHFNLYQGTLVQGQSPEFNFVSNYWSPTGAAISSSEMTIAASIYGGPYGALMQHITANPGSGSIGH